MPAAVPALEDARTARRTSAVLLWIVAFSFLAAGAGARDLFDADEGRYATVARNMWVSGDWVVPRLDDMPFMDKPPLVYWVQAVAYEVFGPGAFAARLPTLLAGSLWCLFLFLFARRFTQDEGAAWCVGLLGATCAAGMIGSRVGPQMDMPLAAAIAGALLAAHAGLCTLAQRATRPGVPGRGIGLGPALGLGTAIGLGLLIKGPLVVAVPALVAVAWGVAGVPAGRLLRVVGSPVAWATALVIAAPWYVLVEQAMPGWIHHFIHYEHFGRFSRGDHRTFHPFWFYIPIALIYLLPWTPLAFAGRSARETGRWGGRVLALVTGSPWSPRPWRRTLAGTDAQGIAAWKLCFGWFLAAFLLYSISTRKLLNYLLPAAGPLVLLTGVSFAHHVRRVRRLAWLSPVLVGGIAMLGGLALHFGWAHPLATGKLPEATETARFGQLGPLVVLAGGLLVGIVLYGWHRRAAPFVERVVWLFGGVALAWTALDLAIADVDHLGSSRRVAERITAVTGPDTPVIAYKRYPQGLGYYSDRATWIAGDDDGRFLQREIVPPYCLDAHARLTYDGAGRPVWDGLGNVITTREMEALWAGPGRVVLLCRFAELPHFRSAAPQSRVLGGPYGGAGRTDLYLLENRPPPSEADEAQDPAAEGTGG